MNPSRESIAVALFGLLQTLSGTFNTISRRPQLWNESTNFPALYMGQPEENYIYNAGPATPPLITLDFDIYVYFNAGLDPNVVPDTQLNGLIDAIEAALAPPAYMPFKQTLGGLVSTTWIEGKITRIPGYADGQGGAFFTIKTLVPS